MKDYNIQTILKITQIVCDYFGVDIKRLKTKTKKTSVVKCRQISQDLSFKLIPEVTKHFIGEHTAGRNRTTVLHSIKTVNNLRETDKKYEKNYLAVEAKVLAFFDDSLLEYKLSSLKIELERIHKKADDFTNDPESEIYLNEHLRNITLYLDRAIVEINQLDDINHDLRKY